MRVLCAVVSTELFTQKNLCADLNDYPIETTWSRDGSSTKVRFNGYLLRRNDDVKY